MPAHGSIFVARAANAFSSLAVTVVLAALTILALAFGTVQDSRAETSSGVLLQSKVEAPPALEWQGAAGTGALPDRGASEGRPQSISRRPLADSMAAGRGRASAPSQEWMGVSKIAFPLLVRDLVAGQPVAPSVMTGRPVGTK